MALIKDPPLWFFRRFDFYKRVPEAKVSQWQSNPFVSMQRWGTMASIFHDQQSLDVFVVKQGKVEVDPEAVGMKKRVILGPGDLFGTLTSDASKGEHHSWLQALDDTTLMRFERGGFNESVVPYLGDLETPRHMKLGRSDLEVPITPLLYTGAKDRIVKGVIHLFETKGQPLGDGGYRLEAFLTGRGLAKMFGLKFEQVRSVLYLLEARQLLRVKRRAMETEDLGALRALVIG